MTQSNPKADPNKPGQDPNKPGQDPKADLKARNQLAPGKPRRGRKTAPVTSIRIDPEAKRALSSYFGSLGNALFYLYQGIEELKENYELPNKSKELSNTPDLKLTLREYDDIFIALLSKANRLEDHDPAKARYVRLAQKISEPLIRGK